MIVNTIRHTSEFKRLYKHKLKTSKQYVLDEIDSNIRLLAFALDPKSLGEKKKGSLSDMYAIRLNRDSRILYRVYEDESQTIVELVRVCNHKQVYG